MMTKLNRMRNTNRSAMRFFATALAALFLGLVVFPRISRASEPTDLGKQLFEKRCTGCHALDRNKEGPRLGGVYGRQAGRVPDFNYSTALKASHFVWDEQRLDTWLTDTQSLVEDNNMDFHVPKAEERAEIIRYLKAISLSAGNRNGAQTP